MWTHKAVEHRARNSSCEAHVEERQGCAGMTRSLWSSSTTRARGAGITILLSAGASPLPLPLPLQIPLPFLPHHHLFGSNPLLKRYSFEEYTQIECSFRNASHNPTPLPNH